MFRRYAIVSSADQHDTMTLPELARERSEKPGPSGQKSDKLSDREETPTLQ